MKINSKDISLLKCKLLELDIGPAKRDVKYEFLNGRSLNYVRTDNENYTFKPIKLKIEIYADSRDEYETCKSNLAAELIECTLQFDNIPGKTYTGYLNGDISVDEKGTWIGVVTCKLYAVCEGAQVTNEFTKQLTFTNFGNSKGPAIVEISTSVALVQLTIAGLTKEPIIVKNVARDVPLIIDGEKCVITQDGVNKFGDTTMKTFPEVAPGSNTIELGETVASAYVTYKPRFV